EGGWCWDIPLPQGNLLKAAWAASPTDLWVVGEVGTLLHYDGTSWSSAPRLTTEALNGVWGSAPGDVWAVGDDEALLHFDGAKWSMVGVAAAPLDGGASAEGGAMDAAAAPSGAADGGANDAGRRPSLFAVAGASKNEVWAVGAGGLILRFDGSTLAPAPS